MTISDETVAGKQIQIDRSGHRHNWSDIDASDLPEEIREEIATAIGDDDATPYTASNGLSYRW